jgi:hypothetical protein
MNKGTSPEQNLEAIEAAARAGLQVRVTLVVGHPGETHSTLRETMALVRSASRFGNVEFLPALGGVYPGTETYRMVEEGVAGSRWVEGVKGNWARARRDRPMIETGPLSSADLLDYMRQIRALIGNARGAPEKPA